MRSDPRFGQPHAFMHEKWPRIVSCKSRFLYLDGLSGLLKPPIRFMYCRYSVFFSFRTPYTLLPLTLVFFVDLKPANPIIRLKAAVSGSESSSPLSTTMASAPFDPLCADASRKVEG